MLAYSRHFDDKPNQTWLVWLHGLLGSQKDWRDVLPFMTDWPCLTLDLPGHGESVNIGVNSFADTDRLLKETLLSNGIESYILIGYSLGGRIALYHACRQPKKFKGVAVEGSHLGLRHLEDRERRILHDSLWAEKFSQSPIENVLEEWYQQPIFSDLTPRQREQLVKHRRHNSGEKIAQMLNATSLGRQPWLGDDLFHLRQNNRLSFCYLCGEYDKKFQTMAGDYRLPLKTVDRAGHNAHRTNPKEFSQQLISFLKE